MDCCTECFKLLRSKFDGLFIVEWRMPSEICGAGRDPAGARKAKYHTSQAPPKRLQRPIYAHQLLAAETRARFCCIASDEIVDVWCTRSRDLFCCPGPYNAYAFASVRLSLFLRMPSIYFDRNGSVRAREALVTRLLQERDTRLSASPKNDPSSGAAERTTSRESCSRMARCENSRPSVDGRLPGSAERGPDRGGRQGGLNLTPNRHHNYRRIHDHEGFFSERACIECVAGNEDSASCGSPGSDTCDVLFASDVLAVSADSNIDRLVDSQSETLRRAHAGDRGSPGWLRVCDLSPSAPDAIMDASRTPLTHQVMRKSTSSNSASGADGVTRRSLTPPKTLTNDARTAWPQQPEFKRECAPSRHEYIRPGRITSGGDASVDIDERERYDPERVCSADRHVAARTAARGHDKHDDKVAAVRDEERSACVPNELATRQRQHRQPISRRESGDSQRASGERRIEVRFRTTDRWRECAPICVHHVSY